MSIYYNLPLPPKMSHDYLNSGHQIFINFKPEGCWLNLYFSDFSHLLDIIPSLETIFFLYCYCSRLSLYLSTIFRFVFSLSTDSTLGPFSSLFLKTYFVLSFILFPSLVINLVNQKYITVFTRK